ncbi:hypothetical protein ACFRR6_01775 [Streptomyces sp. NPDC056891]|uniref:hypothetical protein n=1 Tax=Streptomyces sp. NPDC056891 TaxID=3345961 RepID=UPI0036A7C0D3
MAKPSKRPTRVEALQAVIDSECTAPTCQQSGTCRHEGEKAAARHMLERLLKKLSIAAENQADEHAKTWADIYARGYDSHGSTYRKGAKYRAGQPMKERTAGIRADIKMARMAGKAPLVKDGPGLVSQALGTYRFDPIGEAPDQIKIRVHIGAGYGSIRIRIDNIPQEWGWVAEEVTDYRDEKMTRWTPSQALKDLKGELKAVGEAYNADHGSNTMTDCSARSFFVFVDADDPDTLARRAVHQRNSRARRTG